MISLFISTEWQQHRFLYSDESLAKEAYAKIKEALKAYDRFGVLKNDKETAFISFATQAGEASYRMEHLRSVSFDEHNKACMDVVVDSRVWDERVKAAVSARLAPQD